MRRPMPTFRLLSVDYELSTDELATAPDSLLAKAAAYYAGKADVIRVDSCPSPKRSLFEVCTYGAVSNPCGSSSSLGAS